MGSIIGPDIAAGLSLMSSGPYAVYGRTEMPLDMGTVKVIDDMLQSIGEKIGYELRIQAALDYSRMGTELRITAERSVRLRGGFSLPEVVMPQDNPLQVAVSALPKPAEPALPARESRWDALAEELGEKK